ncbi:MAG: hypothetical protein ACRDT0_10055, partial [Pseudonocardiaceae bacterium]
MDEVLLGSPGCVRFAAVLGIAAGQPIPLTLVGVFVLWVELRQDPPPHGCFGAKFKLMVVPTEGGRHILACLQAEGFSTTCTPGWKDTRYLAAVGTRGVEAAPVQPAGFDPRVVAVDLTTDATTVRLVGLYGPTNGMTAESSHCRREFQSRLLD